MRKVKMRIQSELCDKALMKTSEQFLKVPMLTASEDMMSEDLLVANRNAG